MFSEISMTSSKQSYLKCISFAMDCKKSIAEIFRIVWIDRNVKEHFAGLVCCRCVIDYQ